MGNARANSAVHTITLGRLLGALCAPRALALDAAGKQALFHDIYTRGEVVAAGLQEGMGSAVVKRHLAV